MLSFDNVLGLPAELAVVETSSSLTTRNKALVLVMDAFIHLGCDDMCLMSIYAQLHEPCCTFSAVLLHGYLSHVVWLIWEPLSLS